jgi:hypothetical protein
MTVQATVPAQSISVPSDPALVAMAAQVAKIQAQLAAIAAAPPPNTFHNRILQPYSKAQAYNEHQWEDEWGNITFQILGHGWNQDGSQYHGHGSVYVVDPTDPSGNGRGEAEVWVNAVRDPNDPPSYPYWRKKVGYNHAILMLNDSIIAIRSASGKLFGITSDDNGNLKGVPRQDLPNPAPIIGPNYATAKAT